MFLFLQTVASTNEIAIVIVGVVLALATVVVAVGAYQWLQGTQSRAFLIKGTASLPVLSLHKEHRYHLFLSHVSVYIYIYIYIYIYLFIYIYKYTCWCLSFKTYHAEPRAYQKNREPARALATQGAPLPPLSFACESFFNT